MKYFFSFCMSFIVTILVAQVDVDTIKVNYKANGLSLEEVFSELESEYGVRFSYATSSVLNQEVELDFEDESMDHVMDLLLDQLDMEYKIMSDNILIRKSADYKVVDNVPYQSGFHVKGKVTEPGSRKGLELATIAISNTSLGTYSDEHGRFDIEIPAEHISEELIFHALGYEDRRYKISELKDSYVMVALENGGFSIDEITIVNRKKPIVINALNNNTSLTETQLNNNTSGLAGNDISRQLQLLPGISASDDTSAEIKIRGSNSDETMIILDGIPIYHSSHYFGIFSGINASFIDSLNVYKNNYPLQYDGKTGGIVEFFSNTKPVEKLTGSVSLNLLTASTDITIPLSKSTSLQVAGRTTIKNVSNSQFNTFAPQSEVSEVVNDFKDPRENKASNPQFNFYDINATLLTKIRNKDMLKFHFFKSGDALSNLYKTRLENNQNDRLELLANEAGQWNNIAFGVNYHVQLAKSFEWKTRMYYTKFENELTNDYRIEKSPKGGMQDPAIEINELRLKQANGVNDAEIQTEFIYSKGEHDFQVGLSATQHDLRYKIEENKKDQLDGGKLFYESSIYAGYNGKFTDKLYANVGLRGSYFDINKGNYLSPRVLLNYQWSENISSKASYGYYQQVIRQFHYEYRGEPRALWVSAGQNSIPVLKSHKTMIGLVARIGEVLLDIEMYQKNMDGMIEYSVINPGDGAQDPNQIRDYRLFKGDGLSRGIDVLLSTGIGSYDTYLSYSLSKSVQRFKAIAQNRFYPTEDDRRHQLKWVNTLVTGKFTWGANLIYVSGRRYTDIVNVGPQGSITDFDPEFRFKRLPAYQRLDLSATYSFKVAKLNSNLSLAMLNTFNRQNVKYVQSVSTVIEQNETPINTVIGTESNLLGRTLNVTLDVKF